MPETQLASRYQLLEMLGRGGMGAVYRALDHLTGQIVAVKRVTTDFSHFLVETDYSTDHHRIALTQEFEVLASLRHLHIISVLDYGFDEEDQPFFVMELLENAQTVTLATLHQPLSIKLHYLIQILEALTYLHRQGILHRDLKPANTLVVNGKVKLVDFGLAVRFDDWVASKSGTVAYMAPELLQKQPPSVASDLYSVGIMLYEMLLGRVPFTEGNINRMVAEILQGVQEIELPQTLMIDALTDITQSDTAVTEVGTGSPYDPNLRYEQMMLNLGNTAENPLIKILQKLVAVDPEARYQNASDVIQAVYEYLGETPPEEDKRLRESFIQAARFVGRKTELQQLTQLLEATLTTHKGSAWLIGGESGVGKSRLLDELQVRALVKGAVVVEATAQQEAHSPYEIWRQPLRRLALNAQLAPTTLANLRPLIPDIETLVGMTLSSVQAETRNLQSNLLSAVEDLFRAQTKPVIMILEDLHWISHESVLLLNRVLGLVQNLPVLVLGSYRNDEQPALPERFPLMRVLPLQRLSKDEVAELTHAILGEANASPELLEFVERESEGNVFFVVQVLRALAEEAGSLANVAGMNLPEQISAGGIQRLIQRRLERLPISAGPWLQFAAVAGRSIDPQLLQNFTGGNWDAYEWLNQGLESAIFTFHEDHWQFAHDKLRQAILANISPEEKQSIHWHVAETIARVYPNNPNTYATLAYHWQYAGEPEAELAYKFLAGNYALQIGAYQEATLFFEEILQRHPNEPVLPLDKITLLQQHLGEVYYITGRYDEAQTLLKAALATTSDPYTLRVLGNVTHALGNYDEARGYFRQSIALLRGTPNKLDLARSIRELGVLFDSEGAIGEALLFFEEALPLFQEVGDAMGTAGTLSNLGGLLKTTGNYPQAEARFKQSIVLFDQLQFQWGGAFARIGLGQTYLNQKQFTEAKIYLETAMQTCTQIGHKWGLGYALKSLGDAETALQEWEIAQDHYHQGIAIGLEIKVLPLVAAFLPGVAGWLLRVPTALRLQKGLGTGLATELLYAAIDYPASYDETKQESQALLDSLHEMTHIRELRPIETLGELLLTLLQPSTS